MILILDACSISNLINVFQDNSLLIEINKCFSEVYITPEVIAEVTRNKNEYLEFYKDRWIDIEELYRTIGLNTYIHKFDAEKKECVQFVTKFSIEKKLQFNNTDGEYFSTLLSLYLSRLGINDFGENANKILFVTDDARAEDVYVKLFKTNQVGVIIDSIDLVVILYIKNLVTKAKTTKYIEGLLGLYNKDINKLLSALRTVQLTKKNDLNTQALNGELIQYSYDGETSKLIEALGIPKFRNYFKNNKSVKSLIENFSKSKNHKQIAFLRERKDEVLKDLIWKI